MIRKRMFIFVILISMLMVSIFAGSIKVIAPNGNESLDIGSSFGIKWNTVGIKNNVKITLWRNNSLIGLIIKDIPPQKGTHNWKVGSFIGGSAPSGGGYKIKIREQGGAAFKTEGMSNNNFTLKQGTPMYRVQLPSRNVIANRRPRINRNIFNVSPVLGVATPKNGEILKPENSSYPIQWKIAGLIKQGPVKIEAVLMVGTTPKGIYTVAYSTPNTGTFMWNLKKASWTPGSYKIKISLDNGNLKGESGVFKIADKLIVNNCNQGSEAQKLECLINNYRKSLGLKSIPHSNSLSKVANAHVKDLATYHPENKCNNNAHSWSKNGNWKGGCFDLNDSSTHGIMWYKPKEIAGDSSYGFEIACKGCSSASSSLGLWKGSSGHNNVIINKGMWQSYKWTGMAAAIYSGYSVVWFK